MINSGATPCFPNAAQGPHNIYAGDGAGAGGPGCGGGGHAGGGMDSSSTTSTSSSDAQLSSLICSLSILKGKVHQVQSLVSMFLQAPNHCQSMQQPPGGGNYYASSSSVAVASSMGTLIQDIVVTASSMMFNCQQIALAPTPRPPPPPADDHHLISREAETETEAETEEVGRQLQVLFPSESFFWFGDHTVLNHNNSNSNNSTSNNETSNNETSNCTSSNYNNNNVIMSNNQLSSTTTTQGQAAGYINTNSTPHPRRSVAVAEPRGNKVVQQQQQQQQGRGGGGGGGGESHDDDDEFDIIELDAADLLAKYTHYCQVCGKGFKRDANLRMHMRAHGDEYKSNAALSNPLKKKNNNIVIANNNNNNGTDDQIHQSEYCSSSMSKLINNNNNNNILPPPPPVVIRKYSCPQEGCRWNKKHAKFQPLKSMICVKNHYKRSHCPKLYVCKRCNRKQFSVLSDLRTHEKHCGDLQWQCSCGTTFSRKDKLMGHVALFVGHTPMIRQQPQGKVNDDHRPIQIIQGDVQR